VRIYTPTREIPFAGHPNVGTAYVLAAEAAAQGSTLPATLLFEEGAGLVPVELLRAGGQVVGGELTAPEPLTRHSEVAPEQAAACLSLDAGDLRTDAHTPQVVSVGLPFLVVEVATRAALRRCAHDPVAFKKTLPLDGAVSVYAYTRDVEGDTECDLQARMLTGRLTEDPATGSATCAAIGLIAAVRGVPDLTLRIRQGVDMGRPSLLVAKVETVAGTTKVKVGGRCAPAMRGTLAID
jgi:trans-2,3-dihydro-3-hydroxyanthranilate isomerase